jgi:sugar lactone lactonase YvrE
MTRVRSSLLVCLALFAVKAQAQNLISTVAGGGPDGVVATNGNLGGPRGVRTDGFGTVYIAVAFQSQSDRILRMDTSGQLTVVAGGGIDNGGFRGDGGPAREANLYAPIVATPDVFGNLLIADYFNHRIRKVNASTGVITTVGGTGVPGFSGDGGPAINAQLSYPASVAVDLSGNIFLADSGNNRVRRIDGSTDIITTVAGDGLFGFSGDFGPATSARLNDPIDVAVDAFGNLFIADYGNHAIRRVDVETGIITTVAGTGVAGFSGDGGPATAAQLNGPSGVALDGDGNLFIADSNNQRIRRVDAVTGNISTVAGNGMIGFSGDGGPATTAKLAFPYSIAVDQGNLYIADYNNYRLRLVDGGGNISTVAGNGSTNFCCDGYPATSASLFGPEGAAVDPNGNLIITDSSNNRLRMVDTSGNVSTIGGTGVAGYGGDGGPAINGQFNYPQNVVLDTAGDVFFCDYNNNRIRRVDASTGIVTTVAGTGVAGFSGDGGLATSARINAPNGLAIDASGNLFIDDSSNRRIRKVDAATGIITTIAGNGATGFSGDGGRATLASFSDFTAGVAVDPSGNVFIADLHNNRVRRIDVDTDIITTVAGNGSAGVGGDGGPATSAAVGQPYGLAVDFFGNLYIGQVNNNRVRRVQLGIITDYAGNGQYGYSGDGGVPNGAALAGPSYLSVDPTGTLYVPMVNDGRVRVIAP